MIVPPLASRSSRLWDLVAPSSEACHRHTWRAGWRSLRYEPRTDLRELWSRLSKDRPVSKYLPKSQPQLLFLVGRRQALDLRHVEHVAADPGKVVKRLTRSGEATGEATSSAPCADCHGSATPAPLSTSSPASSPKPNTDSPEQSPTPATRTTPGPRQGDGYQARGDRPMLASLERGSGRGRLQPGSDDVPTSCAFNCPNVSTSFTRFRQTTPLASSGTGISDSPISERTANGLRLELQRSPSSSAGSSCSTRDQNGRCGALFRWNGGR